MRDIILFTIVEFAFTFMTIAFAILACYELLSENIMLSLVYIFCSAVSHIGVSVLKEFHGDYR